MRWALALALVPWLALASEQCVTQLGGQCRATCAPGEKEEQGAFVDCSQNEKCCLPVQAPKAAAAASPTVVMKQLAFAPGVLKVKAGTEVVWRNEESSLHVVTADDGSFTSPPMEEGAVFRRVFPKPGTYSYTCEMHPFMSGKIVVE
ncbi:MAG TPA: cupredoxin domain-containing protein [Anaeromyxobacteraceae bacterium]|nr:cupredoxin domain-containing protein [Anaeromyxobacteraceae bacterium]